MSKKLFALRDVKVSFFSAPQIHENEISAVRALTMAMQNHEGLLTSFPGDYELYQIGDYNEIQGTVQNLETPKFIISCASIQLNMLKSQILKRPSVSDDTKLQENTNAHNEQSVA